jgi:hypothetical protein
VAVAAQESVSARRASAREVAPFAARAMAWPTTGETLDVLLAAGECWLVERDGVAVAGWVQQWQGGNLHVLAYGGRDRLDLSHVLDACLAAQRPVSASFQTRRRGLMRKALARGYHVERSLPVGVLMKKDFP